MSPSGNDASAGPAARNDAPQPKGRPPYRAGAMVLLAVAIVAIGLGWRSAATSGDKPDALQEAADRATTSQQAPPPSSAPASTPAPSSSAPPPADGDRSAAVCVLNNGTVTGKAARVAAELKAKGWKDVEARNLSSRSISELTIVYDTAAQKAVAETLSKDLGGGSVETRDGNFDTCRGKVTAIIVDR